MPTCQPLSDNSFGPFHFISCRVRAEVVVKASGHFLACPQPEEEKRGSVRMRRTRQAEADASQAAAPCRPLTGICCSKTGVLQLVCPCQKKKHRCTNVSRHTRSTSIRRRISFYRTSPGCACTVSVNHLDPFFSVAVSLAQSCTKAK